MQTKLQFLVPFRREYTYLEICLQSIVNQSVAGWTAIVIDDQEEDNDFCDSIVKNLGDERITTVRKKARGMIWDSWNFALSHAKPGLATLFHSDDVLHPYYVESMLEYATRFPEAAAFFTQAVTIDGEGRKRFSCIDFAKKLIALSYTLGRTLELEGESGLAKILKGNFVFCPSLCYVISEDTSFEFKPYRQVLDFDLLTSFILNGRKVVGIPRKLISYRRHSENFSVINNRANIRFEEERQLYDDLAVRAEAAGWNRASQIAMRKFIVYAHHYFINYRSLFRKSTRSES